MWGIHVKREDKGGKDCKAVPARQMQLSQS